MASRGKRLILLVLLLGGSGVVLAEEKAPKSPKATKATKAKRAPGDEVEAALAGALEWRDAAADSGALIRGAALIEGNVQGDAAADLIHDAALLARLQRETGSFARVNGSWKDF